MTAELRETARNLLREHFGYDALRPAQEVLISAVLEGRDVLGIMPTGAGKSMCYQLPALMLPGITLCVSPLISLMQDQVRALGSAGIRGAYLNSSLTQGQYLRALENARQGVYKIIYVAPERLRTGAFQDFARSADISMIAVDEAHCVSQWGHDFRPAYLEIAPFVESLPRRPVLAAFTATATPAVRRDMLEHLQLRDPEIQITGFDRENLTLRVIRTSEKLSELVDFLDRRPRDSGIVYCSTRKNVDRVAAALQSHGVSALPYHAGMPEADRRYNQTEFLSDRARVMVATNAFGMGIDKRNVRFVVHYNMPRSMEAYYQEAGRAGRDGSPAECLLLYNGSDVHTQEYLIRSSQEHQEPQAAARRIQAELEKLEVMQGYCHTTRCLRHYILDYFGQPSESRCSRCGNCLARRQLLRPIRASRQPIREKTLYELLESIRQDFAERSGIPPEQVLPNRSLMAMAAERPANEYEMMQLPGVTPVKYQMYGKVFLRAIQRNPNRRSGVE